MVAAAALGATDESSLEPTEGPGARCGLSAPIPAPVLSWSCTGLDEEPEVPGGVDSPEEPEVVWLL
jgi:hypothetical protein